MDRRGFFGAGAAAALGVPFGVMPGEIHAQTPQIRRYVRLGGTELRISDISFGSSRSDESQLVRHAFERGVNYFDSAESYRSGEAEEAIGRALQGVRDRVYITSKTKAQTYHDQNDMMLALEGSLRRLRTDYVDVYFNHAVNDVDRMRNEEWWAFTERAKAQGKIRFRGMSGHGSHLVESLDYALDHDLVDVILVAFSFGQDPDFYARIKHLFHFVAIQEDLPRVLTKAREKDVGIVAMKTLMGARLNDMRPYERVGWTFSNAAFRWVLSLPFVDALIISMSDQALIDEYVQASGDPVVSKHDRHLLALYAHLQSGRYCQHACNQCDGRCPYNVEISEVLRTRMYDTDYMDHALALGDYANIATDATACLTCVETPCLDACPHGIPIAAFARDAAARFA